MKDLFVVSDLHLGEGVDAEDGRLHPLEDFFHDEAFGRFLEHLAKTYAHAAEKPALVLNGDIFDFLTVTSVPDGDTCRRHGIGVTDAEIHYGLDPTPVKSVYKLNRIAKGHPVFFHALARFIAAGHDVHLLRGNHDLELYFTEVQNRLRDLLVASRGGASKEEIAARLHIHQWFYMEPGRCYIEHGNQYEASNSIRYPLRPILSTRKAKRPEPALDYPLGSLFVRHFYNRVHRLNPFSPRVGSFEQYLQFLKQYNLFDLVRVSRNQYPMFIAALKPDGVVSSSRSSDRQDEAERRELEALASTTDPPAVFGQVHELRVHPKASSKLHLIREMLRPLVRKFLWTTGIGALALYVWLVLFNLIQAPWLFDSVMLKSSLLFLFVLVSFATVVWLANRVTRRLRPPPDPTVDVLCDRAARIAQLARVKLVLMGHTHVVDKRRVAAGTATFANSGTWTATPHPWNAILPSARRMTLLHVVGEEVHLRRWNDDAQRLDGIPLLDTPREGSGTWQEESPKLSG
jgi:UDP-2,3-diacylglucosamine pyrophosphatase LpxH